MTAIRCLLCLLLIMAASFTQAADWPTYLGDNARSGATTESLELPIALAWEYKSSAAPRRAWSGSGRRVVEGKHLRDRVRFDDAHQVAVVAGRVYFGSIVDHQIYCIDAKSGETQWTYFTEAPVRLAPTVAQGRVYAGSDDGYVYCLAADDGSLIWKTRRGNSSTGFQRTSPTRPSGTRYACFGCAGV